ncbi:MAG TPA: ATP-binding protein [Segetibacter sp.]|jgi:signal transduction histidine kinase/BarA-like signal transduction histidine kinase
MNQKETNQRLVSPMHDIKETAKRISQFGKIAIAFALVSTVTNVVYGNHLSTLLVTNLISALLFILYMNSKGYLLFTKIASISYLNFHFILITLAEGTKTGGYLYYCPLLFAIPFLVDNNKRYMREVGLYFFITLTSFIAAFFIGGESSSWQYISPAIQSKMFYSNLFSVVFLCACFAYLAIYLERKYVKAILLQVKKTEEAMEAKSRFLSCMGHELRTPLNGIIGATNLLKKEHSLPEQREYLDIQKYCSDHMLGLVNDILDYNKIEAGKLQLHPIETNIKDLLEKSILPFYNRFEEKQVNLLLNIDHKLDKVVLADDLRLVQVLNNILSNALKFTETGYVKITASLADAEPDNILVLFSVEDTGIGINETDQEKIFDSFWQVYDESTRKYGGTGLGLTICERLLQLMGTCLELESKEGKGSRFYFTAKFPLSIIRNIDIPLKEEKPEQLLGTRILLAEDNVINMLIAKKLIKDWQAELTTAEDGEIALQRLNEDCNYDLILLDLEMPNMDGYTAVQVIKSLYPHIPVLAFTAVLMDEEMVQKLLAIGFDDCILKPFQPMELLTKLRKYTEVKSRAELEQPVSISI